MAFSWLILVVTAVIFYFLHVFHFLLSSTLNISEELDTECK